MKKVRVFIERGADGSYGAYMPDDNELSYCVIGDGDSAAAAINDFRGVYESMRHTAKTEGRNFEEVDFEFVYDLASFLKFYAGKITYAGLSKLTGISSAQLSQYASGYRRPSPKTTQKVQTALHAFGEELSKLRFI